MKRTRLGLPFAVCLVFAGGGASLTKGTTQLISLDTPGAPGSSCTLTSEGIGTKTLVTPGTLVLDKSQYNVGVRCGAKAIKVGVSCAQAGTRNIVVRAMVNTHRPQ